jgi:hypothetical protein
MATSSKKRKPNWTDDELKILSCQVVEHRSVLFGKFSDKISNERKKAVWEDIAKQ